MYQHRGRDTLPRRLHLPPHQLPLVGVIRVGCSLLKKPMETMTLRKVGKGTRRIMHHTVIVTSRLMERYV
jgi:hypothetical protein